MADFETEVKNLGNTSDYTDQFNPGDIEKNKVMAVLAYFGLLILIPLLAAKDSAYARFHCNQGLILFIITICLNLLNSIFGGIPVVGVIVAIVVIICALVAFVLFIMGIINAATGKAKDLPLIGKLRILN